MVLKNGVYTVIKFIALILLPAATTAYAGLAAVWNWPDVQQVLTTSTIVDTFLGALVGISSVGYKPPDPATAGELSIVQNPAAPAAINLKLDAHALDVLQSDDRFVTLRISRNKPIATAATQIPAPEPPVTKYD